MSGLDALGDSCAAVRGLWGQCIRVEGVAVRRRRLSGLQFVVRRLGRSMLVSRGDRWNSSGRGGVRPGNLKVSVEMVVDI